MGVHCEVLGPSDFGVVTDLAFALKGCSKTVYELEDDLCDQRGIFRSREDDELPRPKSFDTGLTLLEFERVTTYMVMEKRGPAIIARAHLAVSSW